MSESVPLDVRLFPCLSDNYGFLARDEATGQVAAVDTPDGAAVLKAAEELGWTISLILNTHWHPDHTQGNAVVQAATGAVIVGPEEVKRAAPLDQVVKPGDHVRLGETDFHVLASGGHTLGHVAFHAPDANVAFTGDTLFTMGCGRMFEGTPEQFWESLSVLAALPPETVAYGAHEYTASNARFSLSVDDDPAVEARAEAIFAMRERGEPTVPTTIGEELATNPMLRAPQLHPDLSPAEAFAAVRKAKDEFKG
ncbi:hydroxyacylglutathione hydrolase [soil metagenome]